MDETPTLSNKDILEKITKMHQWINIMKKKKKKSEQIN